MSNNIPYLRDGWVELDGQKLDGLDFKFDIRKCSVYSTFTVSVLGLRKSKINELAIWSMQEALDAPKRLKVYAGYKVHGNVGCIADGFIFEVL